MAWKNRRWRAVADTPLAALADALINRAGIYGTLLELGLTTTAEDRRSTFSGCGYDTENRWYWLDVAVDRAVADAWRDGATQRRVRELLGAPLLFFKPTGALIRVWFPTRRRREPPAS